MSDAPRILVRPRLEISPEEASAVRAKAWSYVFDCFARQQKKAEAETNCGEDMELAKKERRTAV
jgi:hypothetical protein